jgi:hypothetical protein
MKYFFKILKLLGLLKIYPIIIPDEIPKIKAINIFKIIDK